MNHFSIPTKVTFLAPDWNDSILDSSILARELASQVAKSPEVKVIVMVPNNSCSEKDKREAEKQLGITIVEAKERPGLSDPIEWLNFPPEGFTSDVIVGLGERFGKIAQVLKQRCHCKSIYVASDFDVQHLEFQGLIDEIAALKNRGSKYQINVGLCQTADLPVAIGPKMTGKLSASLCYDGKKVLQLTPGVISTFCEISAGNRTTNDGGKFRALILDGSNKEGLDIAAKAVAQLKDNSYHLFYVSTAREKQKKQIAEKFYQQYGIAKSQLTIRSLPKRKEDLKRLFCEVDLAIMPSSDRGFEMRAIAALSAGLPILVHGDSGFGEALKKVKFGTSSIVDSEDAKEWAKEIKKVRQTDRKTRLKGAESLRSYYDETYSWEKQCEALLKGMLSMVSGMY